MTPPTPIASWRRALVYGLGASGLAASRLLRSRGIAVTAVDRRSREELELAGLDRDPGVELLLGAEPSEPPRGVDGVVVSPGVPWNRPLLVAARRAGLPVIAEVELAYRWLDGPLVAITGSNGKTTTTALTGALLAAAGFAVEVCGNIGRPLSACVEGPPGRIFVAELSSFQLEGIVELRPQAAALLNLAPDHLDRHGEMTGYVAAKRRLFANQRPEDTAVLNADDPVVAATVVTARRRLFSRRGGVADGCRVVGDWVMEQTPGAEPQRLFRPADLALHGPHNLENAMAAALLARALGADPLRFRPALARFGGLPHRLERVAGPAGIDWYDDSKGTNPAATVRSLEGFDDASVHLILGGRNKGLDLAGLAPIVARKARRVYLIGEAADELEAALRGAVEIERSGDLPHAVAAAAEAARGGESVVLSPACASFDQYRSFAARGDHFKRLVAALAGTGDG